MGYVITRIRDCFSALLMSLMALRLVLVDQNPFWLSLTCGHREVTGFSVMIVLLAKNKFVK